MDSNYFIVSYRSFFTLLYIFLSKIYFLISFKLRKGISQTLGNQVDYVAKCGLTKPMQIPRVEKLNGTLRERVKVQRGWKNSRR